MITVVFYRYCRVLFSMLNNVIESNYHFKMILNQLHLFLINEIETRVILYLFKVVPNSANVSNCSLFI